MSDRDIDSPEYNDTNVGANFVPTKAQRDADEALQDEIDGMASELNALKSDRAALLEALKLTSAAMEAAWSNLGDAAPNDKIEPETVLAVMKANGALAALDPATRKEIEG